ncbi:DUF6703 family protein [uncultured Friedmanniella sp.]|uniref:DUF6703 family protein n=1 Tax=uncultured Friedmanniella sp. TaxID=335381 RepID=UPI0035CA9DA6
MPGPAPVPTLRTSVERSSRPLLVRLHRMPKPVVPLLTVVLIAVGVLAPTAIGVAALVVVAAFVAWIAYLSWPAVGNGGRLTRLFMLVLVVLLALARLRTG